MIIFTMVHKNQIRILPDLFFVIKKLAGVEIEITDHLCQWLSAGNDVPNGRTDDVRRDFCHNWKKGYYWHLRDRSQ